TYPVSLEIFPGKLNQTASFTLYEDDGESRDYEKNIGAYTKFSAMAAKDYLTVTISDRDEKGYKPAGERNFIVKVYTWDRPKTVSVNTEKIKKVKLDFLKTTADNDVEKLMWSYDETSGAVYVKVPDTGKAT